MALFKMRHGARRDAFAPYGNTGCAQLHIRMVIIGQTAVFFALMMMLLVGNKRAAVWMSSAASSYNGGKTWKLY